MCALFGLPVTNLIITESLADTGVCCRRQLIRLVIPVGRSYISGFAGDVANLVKVEVSRIHRSSLFLRRNATQPTIAVVTKVSNDTVWQGYFCIPDPTVIKGDGPGGRGDCFRLVVLVVGIAVRYPFRTCEAGFVPFCVVAVLVRFGDCANGNCFCGFPVGGVVLNGCRHIRCRIAGQVAVFVVLEGVFRAVIERGFRQAIGLVVRICGCLVLGVGYRFQKSVGIIGITGRLPFRPGFFGLSPRLVVLEGCCVVFRVSEAEQIAYLVVGEAGYATFGVGLAFDSAKFVVAVLGAVLIGVGSGGDSADFVVDEVGYVV